MDGLVPTFHNSKAPDPVPNTTSGLGVRAPQQNFQNSDLIFFPENTFPQNLQTDRYFYALSTTKYLEKSDKTFLRIVGSKIGYFDPILISPC